MVTEDVQRYVEPGDNKNSYIDSKKFKGFFIAFFSKIALLFLDIVTKELQKKFAKIKKSFRIDTSVLTIILVGAREKVLRKTTWDTLTNGKSGQGNTQKYQFYQQKKQK